MAGCPQDGALTLVSVCIILKVAEVFPERSNAMLGMQGVCTHTEAFVECVARPQTLQRIKGPDLSERIGIGL